MHDCSSLTPRGGQHRPEHRGQVHRNLQFCTGYELNRRTGSYKYEEYSSYFLLWFKDNKVAIIKISNFVSLIDINNFQQQDFENIFGYMLDLEGYQANAPDGEQRKWSVAAKKYGVFIDPREQ